MFDPLLVDFLANDRTGERVCAALTAHLQGDGWAVELASCVRKQIGDCAGDFFCWVLGMTMTETYAVAVGHRVYLPIAQKP